MRRPGCVLPLGSLVFGVLVVGGLSAVVAKDAHLVGPLGVLAPLAGVPFLVVAFASCALPDDRRPDASAGARRWTVRALGGLLVVCAVWFCVSVARLLV